MVIKRARKLDIKRERESVRTNLWTDGVRQQRLGADPAVIVKKVFVHTFFIRNHNFVLTTQQHIAGKELKLWPVAERQKANDTG